MRKGEGKGRTCSYEREGRFKNCDCKVVSKKIDFKEVEVRV